MQTEQLSELVVNALEEIKGIELTVLDVHEVTSITDAMVIVSGSSHRHVQALADNVINRAKASSITPLGIEGQATGDWVLVDLGDVIVHVMRPEIRSFYNLEKLWDIGATTYVEAVAKSGS
jgi:ribosome-associated protein